MSREMDKLSEMLAWQLFLEENPNLQNMENAAILRPSPAVGTSHGARIDGPEIPEWASQFGQDDEWARLQQAALENFSANDRKGKGPGHHSDRAGPSWYNPRPVDPPRQKPSRAEPPRYNPPVTVGKGKGKEPEGRGKGKGKATGVDCTACMEEIGSEVHRLPCSDAYCTDCLTQLIQTAMKGETGSFPPVCCKKPITVEMAKSVLSAADFKTYRERLEDRKSEVQIFCCNPRCSKRLELRDIKGETGSCPTCWTKTCTKCKRPEHIGVCDENNELVDLAKKENWMGCPKCRRLIEKLPGTCNKMRCVCGIAFCYICGAQSFGGQHATGTNGGCDCPVFTEKDVRDRVRLGLHLVPEVEPEGDDFVMLEDRRIEVPRVPGWVQWVPPPPPPQRFPEPRLPPGVDPRFFHDGPQFEGFGGPRPVAPPPPRPPALRTLEPYWPERFAGENDAARERDEWLFRHRGYGWR